MKTLICITCFIAVVAMGPISTFGWGGGSDDTDVDGYVIQRPVDGGVELLLPDANRDGESTEEDWEAELEDEDDDDDSASDACEPIGQDTDADGIDDACDNCVYIPNPNQAPYTEETTVLETSREDIDADVVISLSTPMNDDEDAMGELDGGAACLGMRFATEEDLAEIGGGDADENDLPPGGIPGGGNPMSEDPGGCALSPNAAANPAILWMLMASVGLLTIRRKRNNK